MIPARLADTSKNVVLAYLAYEKALYEFRKADCDDNELFIGWSAHELADVAEARSHLNHSADHRQAVIEGTSCIRIMGKTVQEIRNAEAKAKADREMMREIVLEVLAEKEVVTNTGVGGRK